MVEGVGDLFEAIVGCYVWGWVGGVKLMCTSASAHRGSFMEPSSKAK